MHAFRMPRRFGLALLGFAALLTAPVGAQLITIPGAPTGAKPLTYSSRAEALQAGMTTDSLLSDAFQGEYAGEYKAMGQAATPVTAQLVAEGSGQYRLRAVLTTHLGTLEGLEAIFGLELPVTASVDGLRVDAVSNGINWVGGGQGGALQLGAKGIYGGALELKRVQEVSPTLGAQPPAGATVLLPFKYGEKPNLAAWTNQNWKTLPDGSMQVARGGNRTRDSFGSIRLHLEFLLPLEAAARGQHRGNSGVYLLDRYEIQVLDSFGLIPQAGDVGALYSIKAPDLAAALPPLAWQTYDMEFRAPELDKAGKQIERKPRLTVRLNGKVLHDHFEIPTVTGGAAPGLAATGALRLQDHSHAVRYRNIWVQPLEE